MTQAAGGLFRLPASLDSSDPMTPEPSPWKDFRIAVAQLQYDVSIQHPDFYVIEGRWNEVIRAGKKAEMKVQKTVKK